MHHNQCTESFFSHQAAEGGNSDAKNPTVLVDRISGNGVFFEHEAIVQVVANYSAKAAGAREEFERLRAAQFKAVVGCSEMPAEFFRRDLLTRDQAVSQHVPGNRALYAAKERKA